MQAQEAEDCSLVFTTESAWGTPQAGKVDMGTIEQSLWCSAAHGNPDHCNMSLKCCPCWAGSAAARLGCKRWTPIRITLLINYTFPALCWVCPRSLWLLSHHESLS